MFYSTVGILRVSASPHKRKFQNIQLLGGAWIHLTITLQGGLAVSIAITYLYKQLELKTKTLSIYFHHATAVYH